MSITDARVIKNYHAHVYFSAPENAAALKLTDALEQQFGNDVKRGRWHVEPVGPHPRGSCQITFPQSLFEQVVQWLMLNRQGVTLFVHPNTGNALRDHTDHVVWLGASESLRLDVFSDFDQSKPSSK